MEITRERVQYPGNFDPQEEERIVEAIRLFARALSYEMDPAIESIRSNAELLRGEDSEIRRQTRLSHIVQQATALKRMLDKVRYLSAPLRIKKEYGIEMLDLEETLAEVEKIRKMAAAQGGHMF